MKNGDLTLAGTIEYGELRCRAGQVFMSNCKLKK